MSMIGDDDGPLPGKTTAYKLKFAYPMSNRSRCEHRFPNGSRCKARKTMDDGAEYCQGHMSAHR